MVRIGRWLAATARGFGYLTLAPSPRLRRLREQPEATAPAAGPLPPLPDSAYPPGAVPLDTSGVPPCAGPGVAASDSLPT